MHVAALWVANAWHARSDAASSLVVGIGIIGNLEGYPILDPIAAAIVGFMVAKMGWDFGWDALYALLDRGVDEQEVLAIRQKVAQARQRVLQRHRVLNLMTHVDPWRRPDLDHAAPSGQADAPTSH